jgi:ribosomal protein L37AE/L43A
MQTPLNKPDMTVTGEAWRDEFCPQCKGVRQHERDEDGTWRCYRCGHAPGEPVQRRLQQAWANQRRTKDLLEPRVAGVKGKGEVGP